jgi:3-oxoacyl-(acyl-carrier-protein) synthase
VPARVAGEVRDFDPERFIEHRDVREMDIFIHYAVGAAQMAVEDSGLELPLERPERTGVIVGVGIGGITSLEATYQHFAEKNFRRVSPFFIPRLIPNMASGQIALRFGARGPNYATTSACASGAHAIGESLVLIRDGRQDVMLAGGAEAPVCLLAVGGFSAMRALATGFNDEPERASRPFDARRDGFVIAEGAAVLVLEALDHARARGARVYAEVSGYGANCDAYHMTQPAPEGVGAASAWRWRSRTAASRRAGRLTSTRTAPARRSTNVAETQAVEARVRRARRARRHELDEVDDGAQPRRVGDDRGRVYGARAVARRPPAHHQHRRARPGVRPRLRPRRRPPHPGRGAPCPTPSASAGRT